MSLIAALALLAILAGCAARQAPPEPPWLFCRGATYRGAPVWVCKPIPAPTEGPGVVPTAPSPKPTA